MEVEGYLRLRLAMDTVKVNLTMKTIY